MGVLAFGAAGPAVAQATEETTGSAPAIEVGDNAPSDAQIQSRITNLFEEIGGYDGIGVRVAEGVVTLTGDVIDNAARDELTSFVGRVEGVISINNRVEVSGTLEERLAPAADRILDRARNLLSNAPIFFVALTVFLLIAVGGWILTTRLPIWMWLAPNRFIADIYRALARIAFIGLGVVVALDILNAIALLGAVLGAAGVAGLAVGFAVRDTIENFIASVLLSLRQPFRPNDVVEIQGDLGTVARLTSRETILISAEGNHIRIPNATVYKGRIVNFSRDPQRRFDFDLGVDAEADQSEALVTAVEALKGLPFVLPEPEVGAWVKEVGDSNVILTFTAWVDQRKVNYPKARGEAIRTVKSALEAAGFGLPEPIYRVRLDDNSGPAPTIRPPADRKSDPAIQASLPREVDPNKPDDASTDAAERERSASSEAENLLTDDAKPM